MGTHVDRRNQRLEERDPPEVSKRFLFVFELCYRANVRDIARGHDASPARSASYGSENKQEKSEKIKNVIQKIKDCAT